MGDCGGGACLQGNAGRRGADGKPVSLNYALWNRMRRFTSWSCQNVKRLSSQKKKQGKLGAKGSAGKDGVKVQKGSRIPISRLIYHQYAKWTSTKNNGNCSKDKTKLQCFSHTLLLFYLQGEIGLPGLSLPGQKGEPVRKNHRDRVFVWIELTFFHLCPSKGRVWLVPAVRGWQRTCQHQNTRGSERQPRRTGPSGQPRTSGSWSGRQTGANNNDSAQAKSIAKRNRRDFRMFLSACSRECVIPTQGPSGAAGERGDKVRFGKAALCMLRYSLKSHQLFHTTLSRPCLSRKRKVHK